MSDHHTTVSSKSSTLPVTLAEAKNHLRIIGDDLDTDVQGALEAAVEWCESVTGRTLRDTSTLVQSYECWPECVKFDREPVLSVTSVKYYDASNALQTLASSYYRLHQQSETAAELEWDDTTFTTPSLYDRDDAVQITYAVGYATVPATAKHAIKLALSLFYGDLSDRETEPVRRSCMDLLASCDWGFYR